jgi:hypothetical protein
MKIAIAVAAAGLAFGIVQVGVVQQPQQAQEALAKLAKEKLQAARQAYEAASKKGDQEQTYLWSRRWLEAERALAKTKAEHLAALQDHLERMKKLETLALLGEIKDSAPDPLVLAPTKFYRTEAEMWLAHEKAK